MTRLSDALAATQAAIADLVANTTGLAVCGWCGCLIEDDYPSPDFCDQTHQRAWLLSQWSFDEAVSAATRRTLEGTVVDDNERAWFMARRLLVRRRAGHERWDIRVHEWTPYESASVEALLRDEWLTDRGCTAWEFLQRHSPKVSERALRAALIV